MLNRTKRLYEVFAYTAATDDAPRDRCVYTRKVEALRTARRWATLYGRVELNALYVNADDESDAQGADLLAAWENGTKTTK